MKCIQSFSSSIFFCFLLNFVFSVLFPEGHLFSGLCTFPDLSITLSVFPFFQHQQTFLNQLREITGINDAQILQQALKVCPLFHEIQFLLHPHLHHLPYWKVEFFSYTMDSTIDTGKNFYKVKALLNVALDYKESWAPKNRCFWTVVLEKTLESPLDCKEIQPVHSKEDWSWVSFGRNDAWAETPVLWPPDAKNWLICKNLDAGKDWRQKEKGTTEGEVVGWHHWLNGHEFQ